MRLAMIRTVAARHVRDLVRDRRTLIFILLVPTLIVIIFTSSRQELMNSIAEQGAVRHKIVAAGIDQAPAALLDFFERANIDVRAVDDVAAAVRDDQQLVGVIIPDGMVQALESGERPAIKIVRRGRGFSTQLTIAALRSAIDRYAASVVEKRLRAEGLPSSFAEPIATEDVDVATSEERTGSLLGELLPFLIMSQVVGLMSGVAADMTAGEKERRTIEALLVTPLRRREIVAAKWLVTAGVGAAIGLFTLAVALITFGMVASDAITGGAQGLPPGAVPRAVVGTLMLAAVMSSIQVMLGLFAKSAQQASLFMTPLFLLLIVPFVFLEGRGGLGTGGYAIPFLGPVLLMRDGLAGEATTTAVALVVAVNGIVAAGALLLADRVFHSERAIMRVSG